MKTWNSYGSEHSTNLVMIGRFIEESSAKSAEHIIDTLSQFVSESKEDFNGIVYFPDDVNRKLKDIKLHSLAPYELDQFRYDRRVSRSGNEVRIETDEADISAFLKVLIDNGAKVEVFSAHNFPEDDTLNGDEQ